MNALNTRKYLPLSSFDAWLERMCAKPASPPRPAVEPAEQLALPVELPMGTRRARLAELEAEFRGRGARK